MLLLPKTLVKKPSKNSTSGSHLITWRNFGKTKFSICLVSRTRVLAPFPALMKLWICLMSTLSALKACSSLSLKNLTKKRLISGALSFNYVPIPLRNGLSVRVHGLICNQSSILQISWNSCQRKQRDLSLLILNGSWLSVKPKKSPALCTTAPRMA